MKDSRIPKRSEIDGHDRSAVFEALGSFDDEAVDNETFVRSTLELISLAKDESDVEHYFQARKQPHVRMSEDPPSPDGADAILNNVFTFYGETHDLGNNIDWEHNPGTRHWGHDLNRFAYLEPLIGAYQSTGARKYAEKVIELILDWIEKTDVCDAFIPDKSSYVWASYLNINGHLSAWVTALEILLPSGLLRGHRLLRILKSIHDQLAWLQIVIPEQSNNWVIFGSIGILTTSLFFPELRRANEWIDYSWDRFSEQIDRQILADGVQFELTQHYHYGVARSYARANYLTEQAGRAVPEKSKKAVAAMTHYLEQTITPDRLQLSFNDSDAHRGAEIAAFLLSSKTRDAAGGAPARVVDDADFDDLASEAFPYGGVYILRDRDRYLAFDGGPYGASHQHEDKLSFWLAAFGRSMIVDPGRYIYDNANPFRPYLMTTEAHNTILVDGYGQCSKGHRDAWVSRTPLNNHWEKGDDLVQAGSSYTYGYRENGELDVIHRRCVTFISGRYYLLFDLLEGEGEHTYELRFQFMPGEVIEEKDEVRTTWEDANALIRSVSDERFDISIHVGEEEPLAGWYSIDYNKIEPAPQVVFRRHAMLPAETVTLLLPYPGSTKPDAGLSKLPDGYMVTIEGKERFFNRSELARFESRET